MILKVLFTIVHVVVSVILILVVLLQTGKRADLAGAFGGGGSQTAFGARGAATLLSKATTVCAVVFMVTSLGLSILSSHGVGGSGTVLEDMETPPASTAPATPGPEAEPAAVEGDLSSPAAPVSDPGTDPNPDADPGAEDESPVSGE